MPTPSNTCDPQSRSRQNGAVEAGVVTTGPTSVSLCGSYGRSECVWVCAGEQNYSFIHIATINLGGNLLPQTGEGDLGSPNVWGYVLSYLSTVVYHNANANINSHNPVYI